MLLQKLYNCMMQRKSYYKGYNGNYDKNMVLKRKILNLEEVK